MSTIDPPSRISTVPLTAAPVADTANELFDAYRVANNLHDNAQSATVAGFFKDIHAASDLDKLYSQSYEFFGKGVDDASLGKIIDEANSYLQLTAVAHEQRAQDMRRQMTQRMWDEIELQKLGFVEARTPLPYGSYVPGGAAEWLFPHIDREGSRRDPLVNTPEELVRLVDRITLEKIITQHPTNSNTIELNHRVAEMIAAGLELTLPHKGEVPELQAAKKFTDALQNLHNVKRIPDSGFTVSDEIDNGHNTIMNVLAGRAESLRELMQLAEARFGDAFTPEMHVQLFKAFHVRLGDWAANDKDGNSNIKSEHRLAKVVKQRLMMVSYYREQLEAMDAPFATERAAQFRKMETELKAAKDDLYSYEKADGDIVLPPGKFEKVADEINRISLSATGGSYADLTERLSEEVRIAYLADPQSEQRFALLRMANDLQNSGMRGSHNELRENCVFNNAVMDILLDRIYGAGYSKEFAKLEENDQLEVLDNLILQSGNLRKAARELVEEIRPLAEKNREYKDNPQIQAFHTLQALSLTQLHSDCYENLVLAETKQAKDFLIAAALQAAVHSSNKKTHWLNVVPLFEDPDSLKNYSTIVLKAVNFDGYKKLLTECGGRLQIMFGHSDGWRLAGRIAADGLLGIANMGLYGLKQLKGLPIRFGEKAVKLSIEVYQGLSLSDPARSGGRDPTGNISDATMANYNKNLVQGVDPVNYYNDAASAGRIIIKEITKAAKILSGRSKKPDVDLNLAVCDAAAATAPRYRSKHFDGTLRKLLAHPLINLVLSGLISNFSSRSANRQGAKGNPWESDPKEAQLDGSRAISISTTLFYANTVNTWYVADDFERVLARKIAGDPALQEKIMADGRRLWGGNSGLLVGDDRLSPYAARTLYETSTEYRRIVDKITQGVALSPLKINHMRRSWAMLHGMPDSLVTHSVDQQIHNEYCAAARLGSISFTGETPPETHFASSLVRCDFLHKYVEEKVLPMEDRNYLSRLAIPLFAIHDRIIADTVKAKKDNPDADDTQALKQLRVLHNAMNRIISPNLDVTDLPMSKFIQKAVNENTERPSFTKYVRAALAAVTN